MRIYVNLPAKYQPRQDEANMIYAGGGGGIFSGITKVLTNSIGGLIAGPEEAKIPESEDNSAEERRAQAEAERKERQRNAKRSGRSKTVLTGGGSTAGANTQQATVLGGSKN